MLESRNFSCTADEIEGSRDVEETWILSKPSLRIQHRSETKQETKSKSSCYGSFSVLRRMDVERTLLPSSARVRVRVVVVRWWTKRNR